MTRDVLGQRYLQKEAITYQSLFARDTYSYIISVRVTQVRTFLFMGNRVLG